MGDPKDGLNSADRAERDNTFGAAHLPTSDLQPDLARDSETLQVMEEHLTVSKREIVSGKVRISTQTRTREEIAEVALERGAVDVERVPIGRPIDVAPAIRHEGDTMIVPVVEERLVVTKQLFLLEELHIRQTTVRENTRTPVPLRRQHVSIERTDADGEVLPTDALPANRSAG